jgi:hypothetical protein
MSIQMSRLSLITAILASCSLVLSWVGKSFLESHGKAMTLFISAVILSAIAVVTGVLAIVRLKESREKKVAWISTVMGIILFVPTGAVAVIFLIMLFSKNVAP